MTRRPVHVLVVIDGLGWGGAELLLADFACGAAAAGLQVSVCYLRDSDGSPGAARLRAVGVEPVLLPMSGPLGAAVLPALRAHMRRLRPDVVHTHLGYADVLGVLAARSAGIPVVSTVHLVDRERGSGLKDRLRIRLMVAARRYGARRVVAVSEAARRGYLTGSGDRPAHTRVVHNGVAGTARTGEGPAARRSLGLEQDDLVVVMLSVLRPGKGHDLAFDVVERLVAREPRLRLVVLGTGPLAAHLRGRADQLGGAVRLLGHREDVMSVLDAADVVLHPSEQDAFPTALLEAMAAGVPVVATRVGGISEIVREGKTGLLVAGGAGTDDVACALARLLADEPLRRRLGVAGRERFEQVFTAAAWGRRLRTVYDEVLSERHRDASSPAEP